jgi:sigma-B regulation protein RsbU (phosphoserine phosphatase)
MAGDYCHFFDTDDHCFVVLMDVSGKGVGAAMVASTIHTFLTVKLVLAENLSDVASTLNRFLCATWGGDKYATGIIIRIAPDGVASFISAGHPPMFKFGTEGVEQYDSTGYPLGLFPDTEFKEESLHFSPCQLLCAYSDGYTEASNEQGEQFGIVRLRDSFHAARNHELGEIVTRVNEDVRSFQGRAEEQDDKTIILMRKTT